MYKIEFRALYATFLYISSPSPLLKLTSCLEPNSSKFQRISTVRKTSLYIKIISANKFIWWFNTVSKVYFLSSILSWSWWLKVLTLPNKNVVKLWVHEACNEFLKGLKNHLNCCLCKWALINTILSLQKIQPCSIFYNQGSHLNVVICQNKIMFDLS